MRVTLLVKLRGRAHIRGRRFSPGFLVPFTCGIAALVLPLLRSILARSVRAAGLHGETECHEQPSSLEIETASRNHDKSVCGVSSAVSPYA